MATPPARIIYTPLCAHRRTHTHTPTTRCPGGRGAPQEGGGQTPGMGEGKGTLSRPGRWQTSGQAALAAHLPGPQRPGGALGTNTTLFGGPGWVGTTGLSPPG